MKINFSEEEYRLLLDMIYISDWIMHSSETDDKNNGYKKLRRKLLSFYKDMHCEDRIQYNNEFKDYYESRELEEEMHGKFIDPYDDESFWDELIDQLARRDLINKMGLDEFNKMDWLERAHLVDESRKVYENEFSSKGLNNLLLIKDSDRH